MRESSACETPGRPAPPPPAPPGFWLSCAILACCARYFSGAVSLFALSSSARPAKSSPGSSRERCRDAKLKKKTVSSFSPAKTIQFSTVDHARGRWARRRSRSAISAKTGSSGWRGETSPVTECS